MTHTLVVGGTRGLGRAVVRLLASNGHEVSVIGRREAPEADRQNANCKFWIADLQDETQVRKAANSILEENGPINYLVFCQRYRGKDDDWKGELDVTLTATKNLIELFEGQFVQGADCAIVMVSSVFGEYVGEGQAASYHVGKAGLNQMIRFYAVNLGRKSIRVNGVTPFTFLKEESKDFYLNNGPLHDLYKKITPLGRMGTTEDCANAIAFLCSPQAGFINGQNIYVDGGLSLVWPETIARQLLSL